MNKSIKMIDFEEFRQSAELNQCLADYLDSLAQQAQPSRDRSVGLEFFFVVASYALFLWARNHIDHQRGLQEAELRQLMQKEVALLVDKGHSREEALSAVLAISNAIATRPPDDSVLEAGIKLLKADSGAEQGD